MSLMIGVTSSFCNCGFDVPVRSFQEEVRHQTLELKEKGKAGKTDFCAFPTEIMTNRITNAGSSPRTRQRQIPGESRCGPHTSQCVSS